MATFNFGNVLSNVDAIQTARLRSTLAQNAIADQERERSDREALQTARGQAWSGDAQSLADLARRAPDEALRMRQYFDGLGESRRAREVAETREQLDQVGRIALWVQRQPDPATAYGQVLEQLPEETRTRLPQQYSPQAIAVILSNTAQFDEMLEEMDRQRGTERFNAALAPAAPRGRQGGIQPSPNPAGLNEGIVAAVDTASPLGDTLIGSESGGRWDAQNDVPGSGGVGHFGRGQFSVGRLEDARRAGIIPAEMSPQQFVADSAAQQRVEAWHRQDIEQAIRSQGLDMAIGSEIGGVPVTMQGLVNVAHLGGKDGMRRFVESGGQYNPADANGTRLSDYLAMGARDAASAPDPRVASLMEIAGDPNLDATQKQLVGQLIASMQPPDPTKQPTSVQEFSYGQQNPEFNDWLRETKRAGATQIDARQMGTIPPGYRAQYDEQGHVVSMEPIPGGPAAAEMEQAGSKASVQAGRRDTATDTIVTAAGQAREIAQGGSIVSPRTGMAGQVLSSIPSTQAAELRRQVDVLKSNASIENLTAMRQASPTGGALGNVSDRENAMLAAASGAIDAAADLPDFLRALDNYERTLLRIVHGPEAGDQIFAETRREAPAPPADPAVEPLDSILDRYR